MPNFDANLTMMFNEVEFLDRFAAAAHAGFKGVEFLFPYAYAKDQLADLAGRSQVQIILFNMPPGDWNAGERGLACDPGRITEFQDGVEKAIDYAVSLNCRRIHCMAGLTPPTANKETIRETYVSNLKFAATALAKHDLILLIEGINTRDIPGFYLNCSRQAFDVMRDVAAPNLAYLYDCYHMQIVEGDLSPTIEAQLAKIGHMQIADTPGRHEPGTGEINYDFLFRHIDKIGYKGWIGCEYRPATTTTAGLDWLRRYL